MKAVTAFDGISASIRIEAAGQPPLHAEVRHFQLGHFIVERTAHNYLHNQEVTISFNFILNGIVNFIRLPGRVKVDRHYGVRVEFERSSLLFEASRRLHNAKRYTRPCTHIAEQRMLLRLAPAV